MYRIISRDQNSFLPVDKFLKFDSNENDLDEENQPYVL